MAPDQANSEAMPEMDNVFKQHPQPEVMQVKRRLPPFFKAEPHDLPGHEILLSGPRPHAPPTDYPR